MKCHACGHGPMKRLKDQKYLFCESGLDNWILDGVTILLCPACGVWMPEIPRLSDALDAIACHLFLSPRILSGTEIRFLRKSMGLPAKRLAQMLDIDPAHLSRVEQGRTPVTSALSFMVKAKCAAQLVLHPREENATLVKRLRAEMASLLSQEQSEPAPDDFRAILLGKPRGAAALPEVQELRRRPTGVYEPESRAA